LSYSKDIFVTEKLFKELCDYILNSSIQGDEEIMDKIDEFNKISPFEIKKETLFENILYNVLKLEFNNFHLLFNDEKRSFANIKGKDKCEFKVFLESKSQDAFITKVSIDILECCKKREVIYIETPYILDFTQEIDFLHISSYHQKSLLDKLKDQSYKTDLLDKEFNTALDNVIEKIDELMDGGVVYYNAEYERFEFKQKNGKPFTMKNTANGLKQIGIIRLLLQNRKLPEHSILIMDEPEVHLHPEWQVKLAEIIVILAKELNVISYINSHSPQFIESIEVYSKKYNIDEYTSFYLTQKHEIEINDSLEQYDFKKVERKALKQIYRNLGNAYNIIDEIRGENLANDL